MARTPDQPGSDAAPQGNVRCFVGAFLEPGDAERLRAAARRLLGDAGRLLPAANHHVTLKFLGDVEPRNLAEALDRVARLGAVPLQVSLPAVVGFPAPDRSRMAVAEVADDGTLAAWHAALNDAFGSEGRPFRPHVTLMRYRRPRPLARTPVDPPLLVSLGAPRLYRSDRDRAGARYRPVTRADLPAS
ncbi:MAG: RNA 2',3'-cyclic phosphodiesterase [Gammaproteobacteria bacterium]|nr:RNA 2',3'-cyclic phosphodiesterase [Gammaproteobacteria bacterium]|tara:strand:+ start:114 stop:677 length:564 start_codon:yes stop_codon:yes gene_type:complete